MEACDGVAFGVVLPCWRVINNGKTLASFQCHAKTRINNRSLVGAAADIQRRTVMEGGFA